MLASLDLHLDEDDGSIRHIRIIDWHDKSAICHCHHPCNITYVAEVERWLKRVYVLAFWHVDPEAFVGMVEVFESEIFFFTSVLKRILAAYK